MSAQSEKAISRRGVVLALTGMGALTSAHLRAEESRKVEPYQDDEAYRVYEAAIQRSWIVQAAKADLLVIAERTISTQMCLKPEGDSVKTLKEPIRSDNELIQSTWILERRFTLPKPFVLVGEDELDSYLTERGPGWKGFFDHYQRSGGYLFFSPVGFNRERDVAMVSVNHWCGGNCGGGTFEVYQKEEGEWISMKWTGNVCAWAS